MKIWLAGALLAFGAWQAGQGGYIQAKAWLAQELLRSAWARSLESGRPVRPWPWADTFPLARLKVPRLGVDLIVLSGASGRVLAFGPGHLDGTARPGSPGNAVVAGHRDTHFAFLRRLGPGDAMELQSMDGERQTLWVTHLAVLDQSDTWVAAPRAGSGLTLITCYPFDAVRPGGPQRFVVVAERAAGPA